MPGGNHERPGRPRLRVRRPAAATARPFDPAQLASEPSPVAGITLDEAGELLVSQIEAFGGGQPVTVVAHSMGGTVLTRAAQEAPGLVAHAVYLCAFMPASGVPANAYIFMPENKGELVVSSLAANPQETGGLHLDPASADPAYRQRLRDCFYGDVDPAVADAAIALLTPDAPAGIAVGATALTADGWGSVPRSYVVCTQDRALRPPCSASSSRMPTPPSPPTRPRSTSWTRPIRLSCPCQAR